MRRLVVALALLALSATPARAAGGSYSLGECGYTFADTAWPDGGGEWVGEVHANVVVFSVQDTEPVTATVTCHLFVDGVEVLTTSGSGSGVVAFATPAALETDEDSWFNICTEIDFTSDDTPTRYVCYYAQLPPQEVIDVFDITFDVVGTEVCARTGGDVYVAGEWVWDCKPYGV